MLASLALAGQADFDRAIAMASEDVGTDQFGSAIKMAMAACDEKAPGCVGKIAELRDLDLRQRAYDAAHPAPVKQPPAEQPQVRPAVYVPPTFVVDQPTGFEDIASYTQPPAPWTGIEVQFLKNHFPDADMVCLMRNGLDLPMGTEVPFAESSQKGTPVYGCRAARVGLGQSIWVPEGTTVQIGTYSVQRQAYVVSHAYTCYISPVHDGRIYQNTLKGCQLVKM